jgi:hypothetical protein
MTNKKRPTKKDQQGRHRSTRNEKDNKAAYFYFIEVDRATSSGFWKFYLFWNEGFAAILGGEGA